MGQLFDGGQDRIRTCEGVSQLIYSQPRLTTSVPTLLAGAVGIEPTQAVLETAVLPLYEAPVFRNSK